MYYTFLVHNIARRPTGDQIIYDGELSDVVVNLNNKGAYIKGFTANYTGRLNQNWKTSGFITYTEGESKGFLESLESEKIIEPMSSIPPLFGRFELSYRKNKTEISASFRFNAKKDISKYNISEGIDNHVQTPIVDASATEDVDKYYGTPSWNTFGLNGRYTVNENFTIQGTVTNLFDEHYKEFASGISAPGRNFSVSVQANF